MEGYISETVQDRR